MSEYVFYVRQNGEVEAKGFCPDRETAEREAGHYAMMYSQDGPVKVSIRKCPERKRETHA